MEPPVFIRFLSTLPVLNYFADFYYQVIPEADPRTATWALMSSPDIPVSIVLVYLFILLVVAPYCLKGVKIPHLNNIMVIYNSFVLVLNLWLGISLTWHISRAGYQWGCQKVSTVGVHENTIASLLWVFHCSKIIELVDTLFLFLKRRPLTFLHLYHHSTIVFATWMGARFVPGGSSAIIGSINSWVHFLMYSYFLVKKLRIYKKFITILQIVQFLATIVHCTTALRRDCGYPRWLLIWLMLYMISFLVLFIHFYNQTYWKPKPDGKSSPVSQSSSSSTITGDEEDAKIGNNARKVSDGSFDFIQWEKETESDQGSSDSGQDSESIDET